MTALLLDDEPCPSEGGCALTVLRSLGGKRLTKLHARGEGGIETIPYDRAGWFEATEFPLGSKEELLDALELLNDEPSSCVVRGGLLPGVSPGRIRRTLFADDEGRGPFLRDAERRWFCLDVDGLKIPRRVDVEDQLALLGFVSGQLPDELSEAGFILQWSASSFVYGARDLRAHLWFWLDEPLACAPLALRAAEWTIGRPWLDTSTIRSANQIHYTASPVFRDLDDPVKGRRVVPFWSLGSVVLRGVAEDWQAAIEARSRRMARVTPRSVAGSSRWRHAQEALRHLDADCGYEDWRGVMFALHSEWPEEGLELFDAWSSGGSKYKAGVCDYMWRSCRDGRGAQGSISLDSLFWQAQQAGWKPLPDSAIPQGPETRADWTADRDPGEPPAWLDAPEVEAASCEGRGVPEGPPEALDDDFFPELVKGLEQGGEGPPSDKGKGGGGGGSGDQDGRPVHALEGDLFMCAQTLIRCLDDINEGDPVVMRRGLVAVRLLRNRGSVQVCDVTPKILRVELQTRHAFEAYNPKADAYTIKNLPVELCEFVLEGADLALPPLERIVRTPTITASGELLVREGYVGELAAWVDFGGFDPGLVNLAPDEDDLDEALRFINRELLADFPFADEASRTHAICLALLPLVRLAIDGCTPLHMVTAPLPRSGKGKLINTICRATVGHDADLLPPADGNEEWRKKITAKLKAAPSVINIDNLDPKSEVDSGALASMLTSPIWTDRELGSSREVSVPNEAIWCATGNNPSMSRELADRCVSIHLDPKVPDPSERAGFRHDPIEAWALLARGEAVRALLTVVMFWVRAGMPRSAARLGGFEAWAATMGGICEAVGLPDFLGNRRWLRRRADRGTEEWGEFLSGWWAAHANAPVSTTMLLALCDGGGFLAELLSKADSESARGLSTKLGMTLAEHADRIFAVETDEGERLLKLVQSGKDRATRRRLYRLTAQEAAP